jgi:ribosome-interacting GTPase 1
LVTNLPPQCAGLERKYREATNLRDKVSALEDYMAAIPRHKGTEKLLQQLKTRHAKLRAQMVAEQTRRAAGGGHSRFSIKKEGAAQLVILGPTGLGKSTFLSTLTNAKPEISTRPFTTVEPVPGMMKFEDIQIQLVEAPAIYRGASEGVGWGLKVLSLARNCDGLIIMVDLADEASAQLEMTLEELRGSHIEVVEGAGKVEIQGKENGGIQVIPLSGFYGNVEDIKQVIRSRGIHHALVKVWGHVDSDDIVSFLEHPMLLKPAIVVANKLEVPKAKERLEELRRNFPDLTIMPISLRRGDGIKELPERLFESLGIIRIYTKRPGQEPATKAMIVKAKSSVGEVAKLIHNDLYHGFKFAKIWGSSRYAGERVGITYILNDKDVIEIHA